MVETIILSLKVDTVRVRKGKWSVRCWYIMGSFIVVVVTINNSSSSIIVVVDFLPTQYFGLFHVTLQVITIPFHIGQIGNVSMTAIGAIIIRGSTKLRVVLGRRRQ